MKKSPVRFCAAASALALAAAAGMAGPFTAGNIVVTQIGDGTAALGTASTAVFMVELTPAGAVVQSIPMPVAAAGANRALTVRGSSTSTGHLARSVDGRFLTMAGFDSVPGVTPISSTTSIAVNRVVARVDALGVVDTTTALDDAYSGDDTRCAITTDGTDIWMVGTGSISASAGCRYTTFGATTSIQLGAPPTNTRMIGIFNDQLYISSASTVFQGVSTVGTGIPTTTGQTITLLQGFPTATGPSSYAFFFSDANTLYVADDRTIANGGGIQKWTFDTNSSTWLLEYTLNTDLTNGCRGLTGRVTRAGVTLFASSADAVSGSAGNKLVSVTDTGAASAFATLAVAPANTAYRGVALSPEGAVTPPCYANCDGSSIAPILNVSDFICFQTKYAAGDSYANCDNSTVPPILNVSDFICFQSKYAAGCS